MARRGATEQGPAATAQPSPRWSPEVPQRRPGAHGAVITKVDDRVIDGPDGLVAAVRSRAPGDTVTLTFVDASGASSDHRGHPRAGIGRVRHFPWEVVATTLRSSYD